MARVTLATLVQWKKPEPSLAGEVLANIERWRIDIPQLSSVLSRCDSSVYWLLTHDGAVLAVTAQWISALIAGDGRECQRSATIHYAEVRHTAIPISQLIGELVLGTWLGTSNRETVAFAEGGDATAMPRHLFEITV
jgi:hypothetical protein